LSGRTQAKMSHKNHGPIGAASRRDEGFLPSWVAPPPTRRLSSALGTARESNRERSFGADETRPIRPRAKERDLEGLALVTL
jgi:hypothetical protein